VLTDDGSLQTAPSLWERVGVRVFVGQRGLDHDDPACIPMRILTTTLAILWASPWTLFGLLNVTVATSASCVG